jgi:hypothetical protein
MHLNSTRMTLAGLSGVGLMTVVWIATATDLGFPLALALGMGPPLLLLAGALKKIRNWAELIALFMIPYAGVGVMDVVANTQTSTLPLALAGLSVLTFFAALDAKRRQ